MITRDKKRNSGGFIALMSAIIISVILLLIVVNLSFSSFYSRSNILDSELKERSSALAEACVDTALLKLANNPLYFPPVGGESVEVDGETCIIESVSGGTIINIRADYKNYITKLEVEVDSDIAVIRWEEIP